MYGNAIVVDGLFLLLLIVLTPPLGWYMYRVYTGQPTPLTRLLLPAERAIYRIARVDEQAEMPWTTYTVALLGFSLISFFGLYVLQRVQGVLPLNPRSLPSVEPWLAFNTAISFLTNTNWQAYAGESTMSYLTQMLGLTVQNFISAAVGMSVLVALARGFARHSTRVVGNFWVDCVRSVLYILLPLSIFVSVLLVWRGVPQNLNNYTEVTTITGQTQTIAQGPVASQIAIKHLGTNGGGFFNANSAHPFENPTPFTSIIETLAIFAIPAGLTYTFGKFVGSTRQGWALFAAMTILFLAGLVVTTVAEAHGNPLLTRAGADARTEIAGNAAPGGNMEGKEVRFGIPLSALFAVVTTAASCGAVNSMHDSFTPLGGLVPMVNMQLGEVIFGGVGSGLYGLLVYAVIAMFIAGLMVGRTPEYLGKKLEGYEVRMALLAILILPLSILGFTSLAVVTDMGLIARANPGPHGLSEILYAFSSATGNNGSAFAGLSANSPFYNITTGLAMLIGRFGPIIPTLALAGSLAAKKRLSVTAGTFPTTGLLWVGLLTGVIVITGALTFLPAVSLGPVIEHSYMTDGIVFHP